MTKMKFTPITKKNLVNRFAIVLDASGSMGNIRQSVVDAYNSMVESIRESGRLTDQHNTVTLAIFGRKVKMDREFGHVYETEFLRVDEPAETIAPLTYNDYVPSNGTPLWDATGDALDKLKSLPNDDENVSYVLNVITDGQENESKRFAMGQFASPRYPSFGRPGHPGVRNLMGELLNAGKNGRWTFAFMVPKGTGSRFASLYGIPPGNVQEWEATERGTREAAATFSSGTMSYSTARSNGAKAVNNYFTSDLSKVKTTQVKKLEDLSDRIKIYEVKDQTRIDEFAQKKNKGTYVIGAGYYQLMKKEKVQSHKAVLIREKGKQAIYGGPEARKLLGLANHELTIQPGNHANFDVFLQSKSPNRILPRGTFFAYDHSMKVGEQPTWGTPVQP